MQEKILLRNKIRNLKRQFTQAQLDELSLSVVNKITTNPRVINAHTILLYYSLGDEVNTHTLIDLLLSQGKKILLPYVIDQENMEIRQYTGPYDLKPSSYGIMEPTGNRYDNISDIDVVLVPGMCFDKSGNRLGRGKGYYDRFLKKIPAAYKIGVCFEFQKQEAIPTGQYDVRMDQII